MLHAIHFISCSDFFLSSFASGGSLPASSGDRQEGEKLGAAAIPAAPSPLGASTTPTAAPPTAPADAAVDRLMALGFTREQCQVI
jgi:hypothetical protein